ncbi:hypothetical protein [Acinetobacter soli]|uniref:hypothetical protein n=2 Tax=Acinetobacter soli TaxID=487316 RepID=UPI0020919033|nr:hypothetical protein [Acinetobacter soli]
MVLNGIGGKTIAEAKSNMTLSEAILWRSYLIKRGSLNVGRRIEQAIGNLMAFYHNGKVKEHYRMNPLELMPHEDQPERVEVDLFEILSQEAK